MSSCCYCLKLADISNWRGFIINIMLQNAKLLAYSALFGLCNGSLGLIDFVRANNSVIILLNGKEVFSTRNTQSPTILSRIGVVDEVCISLD